MRQLLRYITPPPLTLLISALLMLAGTLLTLLIPLFAGQLTRTILAEPGTEVYPLAVIVGVWAGVMLLRTLLSLTEEYYMGMVGEEVATSLRDRVYAHLQALPLTWHQTRKRGQVLSLLTSDADDVSGFVTGTLLPLLPTLLTLVGAFVMMARLDITLAMVVILGLPAYVLALKVIGREIRPLARAWMDQYSKLVARAEENLSVLPALKAFGREQLEAENFRGDNRRLLNIWRRQLRRQSLLSPAVNLMAGLGVLVLLWLGSRHIAEGTLGPADLVSLLLYAGLLMSPLSNLAGVYGQVQRVLGSADRLITFFAEQPEVLDVGEALGAVSGAVRFENVTFAYPEREPVLRGLNLRIDAGETIAITGVNGAGKSTTAHLLLRFLAPDSGAIYIDNRDIAQASIISVRSHAGLVAQHVQLLNGTVAENIVYGRPDADAGDIERAARAAHADEFIAELPQGYQTLIGDEGVKLSGGQRQRLSLARTLLRDPAILILDEATAMFDPAGEARFIEECHEVLKAKTVILITHRPASLALADRVLKMEDGQLQESAEHRLPGTQ
ncbi:ABC transporter ATP-binding protein [Pseudohalioglobus lutimaris]|uniref:ABC transporter ATP-binding protein n=1 Tax=Pseudohalioglobus lutimaris TaxID=1737061 RepID=A0A2N5X1P6_9GAMM|nr:ABC transporter ATP-binding protein [Pseudohalioglobus lutimaris]PLW68402.1 ABC transporter ATP-binding protein [Pseudohalioglobus lutimaris]